MAFTDTPKLGVGLASTTLAAEVTSGVGSAKSHRLGEEVLASDGKRYVYAQAGATISGATAVAAVNASTFVAAATGGSYLSPATAMATGDQGWFAAASV